MVRGPNNRFIKETWGWQSQYMVACHIHSKSVIKGKFMIYRRAKTVFFILPPTHYSHPKFLPEIPEVDFVSPE